MTFINLSTTSSGAIGWLQAHPLAHDLPPSALHMLSAHAELRQHSAGTVVFHEGDAAQHWLGVVHGCVEVVRFDCEGNERVFHCFHSGQCVAEAAMFMGHGRYPMQVRAAGATAVWRLTRSALHQTCQACPLLALRLLENFSQRLYRSINEQEWLTSSSAPQRLAASLLQLSAIQGEHLQLPTSQRQLAAHLGIRAETLSRLLTTWQAQRWICGQRRHWSVLDKSALQRLAGARVRAF